MKNWQAFKQLPMESRIQTLYERGDFIVSIRYYQFKVNLYALDGFLVEVFVYHKDSTICKISRLDEDSTRLSFYCDQIKLPDVFA
ncbi:MAG: hypothetical protein MUF68_05335 [Cyclobacteriaceae bacterium]|nr:hypothetical protein [Cyclobacteriaceae bacterium]